jgi:hypothetical protein
MTWNNWVFGGKGVVALFSGNNYRRFKCTLKITSIPLKKIILAKHATEKLNCIKGPVVKQKRQRVELIIAYILMLHSKM